MIGFGPWGHRGSPVMTDSMSATRPTPWRLPGKDERILVLGSTGSGKTSVGGWLIEKAPFHQQPYVIVDYKRDGLFKSIDKIVEIGLNEVPSQPGLYIVRPFPDVDDDAMIQWLRTVLQRERIGLYFDEALEVPSNKGALRAIFTQGRSKHIPVIALSQRPVDLLRYAFSETNYVALLNLTDLRDRKKVKEFVGIPDDLPELPEYFFRWYDVAKRRLFRMSPVPIEGLAERISARLPDKRRFI